MAKSYYEDNSIAEEGITDKIGETARTAGKALDAVPTMLTAPLDLAAVSLLPTGAEVAAKATNVWNKLSSVFTGAEAAVVPVPGVVDKLKDGIAPAAAGSLTPIFAGLAAAGSGIQALGALRDGEKTKALNLTVRGAAEAGVVFFDGMTMGLGEIASLLATGKFLSTNVGNAVVSGLENIEGLHDKPKPGSLSSVPATVAAGMPVMSPVAMPPQVQPLPGMQYVMVPAGTPVPAAPMQAAPQPAVPMQAAPIMANYSGMPAPANGWASYVAAQRGQQPQQVALDAAAAQNYAQRIEAARQAAAQGAAGLGNQVS